MPIANKVQPLGKVLPKFLDAYFKRTKSLKRNGSIVVYFKRQDDFETERQILFHYYLDKLICVTLRQYYQRRYDYIKYFPVKGTVENSTESFGQFECLDEEEYTIISTEEEYFQLSLVDEKTQNYTLQDFKDILTIVNKYEPEAKNAYLNSIGGIDD